MKKDTQMVKYLIKVIKNYILFRKKMIITDKLLLLIMMNLLILIVKLIQKVKKIKPFILVSKREYLKN